MSEDLQAIANVIAWLTEKVKRSPIASALTCETEMDVAFRSLNANLQTTPISGADLTRLHGLVTGLRQQVAFVQDLNGALLAKHNCRIHGYDRAGRPAGAGLP